MLSEIIEYFGKFVSQKSPAFGFIIEISVILIISFLWLRNKKRIIYKIRKKEKERKPLYR